MERNNEVFTVVFSPGALKDIQQAKIWYNQQQRGLGKKFVDDVKGVIVRLKQNPFLLPLNTITLELLLAILFHFQYIMNWMKKAM